MISLAIAFTMSVCLFMTMRAAVPKLVWQATNPSKSIRASSHTLKNGESWTKFKSQTKELKRNISCQFVSLTVPTFSVWAEWKNHRVSQPADCPNLRLYHQHVFLWVPSTECSFLPLPCMVDWRDRWCWTTLFRNFVYDRKRQTTLLLSDKLPKTGPKWS